MFPGFRGKLPETIANPEILSSELHEKKRKKGGCSLLEMIISSFVDMTFCVKVNSDNVLFLVQFSRPFEKLYCVCCGCLK